MGGRRRRYSQEIIIWLLRSQPNAWLWRRSEPHESRAHRMRSKRLPAERRHYLRLSFTGFAFIRCFYNRIWFIFLLSRKWSVCQTSRTTRHSTIHTTVIPIVHWNQWIIKAIHTLIRRHWHRMAYICCNGTENASNQLTLKENTFLGYLMYKVSDSESTLSPTERLGEENRRLFLSIIISLFRVNYVLIVGQTFEAWIISIINYRFSSITANHRILASLRRRDPKRTIERHNYINYKFLPKDQRQRMRSTQS